MAFTRRSLDIILSCGALIALAPLLTLIAIIVRCSLGTGVIFAQLRIGHHTRSFHLYKFRTMTAARDLQGLLLPDEKRLTLLGRFLRRTSLDELPQLWNVLKGDMSLVGPRPLLPEYLPFYSAAQMRRHCVKPGITGLAQVCGRNSLSWDEKFAIDIWYVDHRNLGLDLRILWRTLRIVLCRTGISQAGHATMPRFSAHVNTALGDSHSEVE